MGIEVATKAHPLLPANQSMKTEKLRSSYPLLFANSSMRAKKLCSYYKAKFSRLSMETVQYKYKRHKFFKELWSLGKMYLKHGMACKVARRMLKLKRRHFWRLSPLRKAQASA